MTVNTLSFRTREGDGRDWLRSFLLVDKKEPVSGLVDLRVTLFFVKEGGKETE